MILVGVLLFGAIAGLVWAGWRMASFEADYVISDEEFWAEAPRWRQAIEVERARSGAGGAGWRDMEL